MYLLRFLFAINTIAMVKDQSLFSYVAPGNIFAWILMPLRYFMPLRHFVWLNRTIIKITHFSLLFCIFLYEKYILSPSMFEPTDFVDNPGLGRARALSINPSGRSALFSPTIRIREESVAGFQQDRALEEVFRRTPATLRTHRMDERKRTQTAIRNWMDQNETIPESPNNNYSTIESRTQQEWGRKFSLGKERPPRRFRHPSEARSVASDPAELVSNVGFPMDGAFGAIDRRDHAERTILKDQDADDELVTNDDDDEATAPSRLSNSRSRAEDEEDYFTTPIASRFNKPLKPTSLGSSNRSPAHQQGPSLAKHLDMHSRTMSSNTILYNPAENGRLPPRDEEMSPGRVNKTRSRPISIRQTPVGSPVHRSPRRTINFGSRPRPIMPPRGDTHTAPNVHRFGPGLAIDQSGRRPGKTRRMSSSDLLDIQSDLAGVGVDDAFGAVPSSFVTQMAMATGMIAPGGHRGHEKAQRERDNDRDRMGRLVLARMKTLEEGFADMLREMKTLQRSGGVSSVTHSSASEGTGSGTWHPGDGDRMKPFTTVEVAGRGRGAGGGRGYRIYQGGSSSKASGSRPESRRGGNKSNRNSVILRSPISSGSRGGKGKGREREPETTRAEASEFEVDDDFGVAAGVDAVGGSLARGGSL